MLESCIPLRGALVQKRLFESMQLEGLLYVPCFQIPLRNYFVIDLTGEIPMKLKKPTKEIQRRILKAGRNKLLFDD